VHAQEYNVVAWGGQEFEPEAGVAVFVPGDSGRLAAVRHYDDADYRDRERSQSSVAARPSV
jgi:hypothetical protein